MCEHKHQILFLAAAAIMEMSEALGYSRLHKTGGIVGHSCGPDVLCLSQDVTKKEGSHAYLPDDVPLGEATMQNGSKSLW